MLVQLRDAVKDCLRASQMRVSETEVAFTEAYMASRTLNRRIEAALGRQEVSQTTIACSDADAAHKVVYKSKVIKKTSVEKDVII